MIEAGINDQTMIGPFIVNEEVKLNSANKCDFMNKTFFALYKSQSLNFKVKCVFFYVNATSYIAKLTCEFFKHK